MPNADAVAHFVTKVLPLIHRVDPDVRFKAVGAVDDSFCTKYKGSHVEFTGPVPDLAEALSDCAIGVCPIRLGAGVQNKMLDYMSLGMAAVTTQIGAEGLDGLQGDEFVIANDAQQMADAILTLLADAAHREQMAYRGRSLVESHYSWAGRLSEFPSRILTASSG